MVKNLSTVQEAWIMKISWRRAWQPTPVFWPGESHGQRSLAECSPRGHRELDTTERLTLSPHVLAIINSAAVNTGVHVVFFLIMIFSAYMPSNGISGSYWAKFQAPRIFVETVLLAY